MFIVQRDKLYRQKSTNIDNNVDADQLYSITNLFGSSSIQKARVAIMFSSHKVN